MRIGTKNKEGRIKSESCIAYHSTLYAMTGSADAEYPCNAISQMAGAAWKSKNDTMPMRTLNAFSGALLEMAPKDIIDGILCRRILILEHHINENFAQAATSETIKVSAAYTNNAAKLSRILNETIEARAKYLRKGEQKVTVQYQNVNVGEGGQAVVAGTVVRDGGGVKKQTQKVRE